MRKRLWSILLVLCMVLTLAPVGASAAEIVDSGSCGEHATWTLDSNGLLTISGTGDMYDTDNSNYGRFSGNQAIKSVVISNGITSIGGCAFFDCENLTSVTIPNSVKSIGDGAFDECLAMTSISIPDSVTSIGRSAFSSSGLRSVTIPDSVTSIGYYAFDGCQELTSVKLSNSITIINGNTFRCCYKLKSIVIPDGVTDIAYKAFYQCFDLSSVTIPDSVTSIGDSAFYQCFDLSSVTIPDSVTSIGDYAFSSCENVTSITIPKNVESIGSEAFSFCTKLKEINVSEDNLNYKSFHGVLMNRAGTALVAYPGGVSGAYTIPEGVTRIEDSAFRGCENLTSLTIPSTVSTIGEMAFEHCSNLNNVVIPNSVTSIGHSAFSGCALSNITIPGSVSSIEQHTFAAVPLKNVIIENGVTNIDKYAFDQCDFSNITIPDSVINIDEGAFAGCYKLTFITIPNSVRNIGDSAFSGDGLFSVVMGNGVTSIGAGAFLECRDLTDVYYVGSEAQWKQIAIEAGNEYLLNARIHFNSDINFKPQPAPTPKPDPKPDPVPEPQPAPGGFTDVSATAYYTDAVRWAMEHEPQITKGVDDTHFGPERACTRAQIVTFLWRAAGEPKPEQSENPFTDVKQGDYYYDAVLWAVEQGITTGTGAATFSPDATVTRAQTVTFLWRAAGEPKSQADNPFADVASGQYYSDAVLWAVENGITTGKTATTFAPNDPCTRAQIVTFLYRDLG